MKKPKILIDSDANDGYFPIENIIILSSYNSAILYHEYRHYIQAKFFGANFLLDFLKYTFTTSMVSIGLLVFVPLINYFFPNPSAGEFINLFGLIALISYAPTFLTELDANAFAAIRLYKKNKRSEIDKCVYSMFSYFTLIFIVLFFVFL